MFKKRKSIPAQSLSGELSYQQAAFPPIGTTLPQPQYQGSYSAGSATARPTAVPTPARSIKKVFKRFFIVLLIVVLIGGGFLGSKFLVNIAKAFQGNLFGLFENHQLKGEDQGRVNILLAGNSADDKGHGGAQLTDSIMLLSIDTKDNTAFMMSIPRDLYVHIPDNGYAKINEAYPDGQNENFQEAGYPDGGMGLLEKVVSEDLGIQINYYALIDYSAFRDAVNAVGGIDVNIKSDDPRGLYDPSRDWTSPTYKPLVKLSNGWHHLDGQQALNLARARGDTYGSYGYGYSDFTRTANQRMMLVALKNKAESAGVLANPVKLASLMDSFGNNVTTDFQTSEVRRLYDISKQVPSDKITSVGLNDVHGKNLLQSYTTRSGQSALVPNAGLDDYSAIQSYLDELMTPPASNNQ